MNQRTDSETRKKASHPIGAQIAGGTRAAIKRLADPENQEMIRACASLVMEGLAAAGLIKADKGAE